MVKKETKVKKVRSHQKANLFELLLLVRQVEQAIEARMLFVWANYILEQPTIHLSKHYDGIRVSIDRCNAEEPISLPGPVGGNLTGVDALCMHSTQFIKDQTGFEMRIRHKVHKTCFDVVSAYAEKSLRA